MGFLPGSGQVQISYYGIIDKTEAKLSDFESPVKYVQTYPHLSARMRILRFLSHNNIKTWTDLENLKWGKAQSDHYGRKSHQELQQIMQEIEINIPEFKALWLR